MSSHELKEILHNGAAHLGLEFLQDVENEIIRFSQGFPHFSHLLGKHCCKAAFEDRDRKIRSNHLQSSVRVSVDRVDETVRHAYQRATMTAKISTSFRTVVWACAEAKEDEHGTFKATDVAKAYSKLTNTNTISNSINYYIGKLCTDERGRFLERVGAATNIRYRFRNPLLRAYVQLKQQATLASRPTSISNSRIE